MNTRTRTVVTATAGLLLVGGVAALPATGVTGTTATSSAVQAADDDLAKDLRFTREEERMARDLYAALAKAHDGAAPMSRITLSEQQHFDAVGTLLERYDVDDPSAGLKAGTYAFPALQDLYDQWYAEGRASLDAAYDVGVELEERDIADLEQLVADTTQDDARLVFSHLLRASEQHLAAFEAAADGTAYGPGQMGPGQMGPGQGGPGRMGQGHGPQWADGDRGWGGAGGGPRGGAGAGTCL